MHWHGSPSPRPTLALPVPIPSLALATSLPPFPVLWLPAHSCCVRKLSICASHGDLSNPILRTKESKSFAGELNQSTAQTFCICATPLPRQISNLDYMLVNLSIMYSIALYFSNMLAPGNKETSILSLQSWMSDRPYWGSRSKTLIRVSSRT